jgi:aminoglycoside 2'-N-acetyltransferase I
MPRTEVRDGGESWPLAEPVLRAVWPPEVMASLAWRGLVFAHADRRVLARDESGRLVCHVGLFLREIRWDGRPVNVGGIGGVATLPDCRGRGFASIALRRAADCFADAKLDFGLLFCEAARFDYYRNQGWRQFHGSVTMEQPNGRSRLTSLTPFVLDIRLSPRSGDLDLCGLPW